MAGWGGLHAAVADAVHVRTHAASTGGHAVGVLYNATADGAPGFLIAQSAPVPIPAAMDGWLRLPFDTPQHVGAGTYYMGYLLDKDQGCFALSGTGRDDVYSTNSWPVPSAAWGPDTPGGSDFDVFASVLPPT